MEEDAGRRRAAASCARRPGSATCSWSSSTRSATSDRDPRGRVVTRGVLRAGEAERPPRAGRHRRPRRRLVRRVATLPKLAFDHAEILDARVAAAQGQGALPADRLRAAAAEVHAVAAPAAVRDHPGAAARQAELPQEDPVDGVCSRSSTRSSRTSPTAPRGSTASTRTSTGGCGKRAFTLKSDPKW